MTKFQNNLIEARKRKGWNQTELAARVNLSQQTISFYELGKTHPRTFQYMSLCKVLDVDVEWLDPDKLYEEKIPSDVAQKTIDNIFAEEKKDILDYYYDPKNSQKRYALLYEIHCQKNKINPKGGDAIQSGEQTPDKNDGRMGFRSQLKFKVG